MIFALHYDSEYVGALQEGGEYRTGIIFGANHLRAIIPSYSACVPIKSQRMQSRQNHLRDASPPSEGGDDCSSEIAEVRGGM
jgi:hypothetical protein